MADPEVAVTDVPAVVAAPASTNAQQQSLHNTALTLVATLTVLCVGSFVWGRSLIGSTADMQNLLGVALIGMAGSGVGALTSLLARVHWRALRQVGTPGGQECVYGGVSRLNIVGVRGNARTAVKAPLSAFGHFRPVGAAAQFPSERPCIKLNQRPALQRCQGRTSSRGGADLILDSGADAHG